jgi:hypothetical protein
VSPEALAGTLAFVIVLIPFVVAVVASLRH